MANEKKTSRKKFRVAVSGSTVDGREISPVHLREYDRAERELVAAFNAVRKVKTPGGFITYETDRARGISHGDLAWATMLAVINEPIGGEGENERFTVMEF